MKRSLFLAGCLAVLVAIIMGCGRGDEVLKMKTLPEIDITALDTYADFQPARIAEDRLWVLIEGAAKGPLLGTTLVPVQVQRYTAHGLLDTVDAYIIPKPLEFDQAVFEQLSGAREAMAAPPAGPTGAATDQPARPDAPAGGIRPDQPRKPLAEGDPVLLRLDGTSTKSNGYITKLVVKPASAGPGGGDPMRPGM